MTHFSCRLSRWLVGAVAIVLIVGRPTVADVFVHLDASVPDSLIDDNGVITWLDPSGPNLSPPPAPLREADPAGATFST